ncbi:hypothetical protein EC957_008955 [Mortierella hygrophila]|uniref:Uncharacterized protein n=1 Tax=Mortierella hygrophila TaxID=979708 RepID=A0A9P6EVU4_9FUNG|nr:hypothetical protein EC957_008955 [Mortierella hygrophila]
MNLHVRSNTFDSLIFSIPRKVSNDIPIGRILMDTYDITNCSTEQHPHHSSFEVLAADPLTRSVMVQQGLTINGTVYLPTIPSPPGFHAVKVNFRRMPLHYKLPDIHKLFSSRRPKQVKVGPGTPVILNTAGAPSPPKPTRSTNNVSKAHPANHTQQKDAEGFQLVERKKRTSKKRAKTNKTTATHMVGVEPTSPAVPATQAATVAQAAPVAQATPIPPLIPQEAAQVVNPPPPGRVNRLVDFVTGGPFQGSTAGHYRQTPTADDSSDSDSESAHTPPIPHITERPQRQRPEVDYNLARRSRQSIQRSDQ